MNQNNPTKPQNPTKLHGKLQLCTQLGSFLSDQRIVLLEAIASHGSLSAAARAIPMSYKAAWEALNSMNNLADQPLVIRSAGGKNGGGTELTPYAHKLICLFKAMELEYQASIEHMERSLQSSTEMDEVDDFRKLMRRVNFRSSARNQWVGKVTSLTVGAVNVMVALEISPKLTIIAAVTKESAQTMGIEFGKELIALIKSSQMILQKADDKKSLKLSASNQLQGTISQIQAGAVCSDIVVALDDQKSFGVTITRASVEKMKLQQGDNVTVNFNAAAVTLCQYG